MSQERVENIGVVDFFQNGQIPVYTNGDNPSTLPEDNPIISFSTDFKGARDDFAEYDSSPIMKMPYIVLSDDAITHTTNFWAIGKTREKPKSTGYLGGILVNAFCRFINSIP